MSDFMSSIKFGFIACLLSANTAVADDTEVFFSTASSSANPNIMFILDTSGSMSAREDVVGVDADGNAITYRQSRIGILQDVMVDLISKQQGINMGLARFSSPGGPILYPITDPDTVLPVSSSDPVVHTSIFIPTDDALQSDSTVTLGDSHLDPDVVNGVGIIGLRFQNVKVPQGATLSEAKLIFSADSSGFGGTYQIFAEVVPNASAFSETNNDLSGRLGGASEIWTSGTVSSPPSGSDVNTLESSSLINIIQPVIDLQGASLVDPAGWCGGNDMVILLKKLTDDGFPMVAYDENDAFSPQLSLTFNQTISPSKTGCYADKIVTQVANGAQDSELRTNGRSSDSSSDLEFFKEDSGRRKVEKIAISFKTLGIPKDAIVSRAVLVLTADQSNSGPASVSIFAINSANPPITKSALGIVNLISGVSWANVEPWFRRQQYTSPDFSAMAQSLFALPDWDISKSMTLILKDGSGKRSAESYNGSVSEAPQLEIDYVHKYNSGTTLTKRNEMLKIIEDIHYASSTPISDTMAEVGRYFKGEDVYYGKVRGSSRSRYNRVSHMDAIVSGSGTHVLPSGCTVDNLNDNACRNEKITGSPRYISPIALGDCQANHIVLLSDGSPTSHNAQTARDYRRWATELGLTSPDATCSGRSSGKDCIRKMAKMFANEDVRTGSTGERITTHTIAFYESGSFLAEVAAAGGGVSVIAQSKDELIGAFDEIVASVLDVNTSFVTAGVSVNQFNRLTHSEKMYFSLFKPTSDTIWPGNLKRYQLIDGVLKDESSTPKNAVTNGVFNENIRSAWSTVIDGNDIKLGGAAEHIPINRTVYSNIESLSLGMDLTSNSNRVDDSNNSITEAMIGASNSTERTATLNWTVGKDLNDLSEARKTMGDPLHSTPILVNYSDGHGSVYVATNEGFLHSIDRDSGIESWSFIPKELLNKLTDISQKKEGSQHTYGLDGAMVLYIDEVDGVGTPGVIDSGEQALLYIGMRRGGKSYYVLDVSNRTSPKLQFVISQTSGGNFDNLGQTWSSPVIKKMHLAGSDKVVMMFGGGYDVDQDTSGGAPTSDNEGASVYIVDAITGAYLWNSAAAGATIQASSPAGSLSTMNSVPNSITAFDLDGDKKIDHFYATDTNAQVFRFDISSSGLITGGRVAHLNADSEVGNRRFYNSADIALIRTVDNRTFISISMGSGYRAHPLDEIVNDHFYMVKDEGVLSSTFDMDADLSSLVDITLLIGNDSNGDSKAAKVIYDESSPKNGWYIDFSRNGEKVISDSLTFNNSILFTTFTPTQPGQCSVEAGKSRLYALQIVDGNPYVDINHDNVLDENDRSIELDTIGIAPKPQILIDSDGARLCAGTQCGLEELLPEPPKGVMGTKWINKRGDN